MNSPRVLIVEDEPALADAMRYALEREGMRCAVSADGAEALARVRTERPSLVVLDLMLPGLSGEEICRAIRRTDEVPIIIVSAKTSEVDRVLGLELGADDYLTKPFSTRELVARVRTVLRRSGHAMLEPPSTVTAGPIALDIERHEVRIGGSLIELPPKEFLLLETLVRRAGRLCTRDSLIALVWGPDYYGDTRTLDVHIKRLRAKIEPEPRRPALLKTIRGLGYKLEI